MISGHWIQACRLYSVSVNLLYIVPHAADHNVYPAYNYLCVALKLHCFNIDLFKPQEALGLTDKYHDR